MQVVVTPEGMIRYVYDETVCLNDLGAVTIRRASHVEPDDAGRWRADLRPVGGPILGPFEWRSAALAAEVAWLAEHWL